MGRKRRTAQQRTRQRRKFRLVPSALAGLAENLDRDLIHFALKKHKGKITKAASELGITRPTFYELMDKLGIERP